MGAIIPALRPRNNLSDLLSTPSMRALTIPVTRRPPTGADLSGYTVGQSLWIDPQGQTWQLTDSVGGKAIWTPFAPAGIDPGALVSSPVFVGGTRRSIPSYTGNLFDVTRATDLAVKTIGVLPNGDPDISTLAAFLAPSAGIGYCTKQYEQSGGTNHATQTVLAYAPQIDMSTIVGTNIPLLFNFITRAYYLVLATYTVTWSSGTGMTFTTLPVATTLPWILPGINVAGTNIPGGTTLVSINYSTGAIVLSNAPTGTPGSLAVSIGTPGCFMDLPNTMQVPWQSWSVAQSLQFPALASSGSRPIILGVHGADAASSAGSWAGIILPGRSANNGCRTINGNSLGDSQTIVGVNWSSTPQIVAFAMGGTGGRNLTWQFEGLQGQFNLAVGTTPATTLSGGSIGFSFQFGSPVTSGDLLVYDTIITPNTISLGDMTRITAAVSAARGWKPQVRKPLVCDGSSTTFGTGGTSALSWPGQLAMKLADALPVKAYDMAKGGTIEISNQNFSGFAGAMAASGKDLIIFHPGMGNSLQAGGSLTVSATDQVTGILTTSGSTVNTSFAPGGYCTGNVNLPAGASIIAVGGNSVQVDPSHLPTGNVGTITMANDTGAQAWASIVAYCATAITSGYSRIVLIGSASRGTFTGGQLTEFNNLKAFIRELWGTVPGVVGFVDYEDDPVFGDDGGMTVTAVNAGAQTVTVSALSAYAASANRIRWAGMPVNLGANTGGQTIAGVSGLVLTLSGATTGLSVGSIIRAINPTPWTTYSSFWPSDKQHFTMAGYQRQGARISQYLLDNALLR